MRVHQEAERLSNGGPFLRCISLPFSRLQRGSGNTRGLQLPSGTDEHEWLKSIRREKISLGYRQSSTGIDSLWLCGILKCHVASFFIGARTANVLNRIREFGAVLTDARQRPALPLWFVELARDTSRERLAVPIRRWLSLRPRARAVERLSTSPRPDIIAFFSRCIVYIVKNSAFYRLVATRVECRVA